MRVQQLQRLLITLRLVRALSMRPFTLITFDVDGTLIKGSGKSADASAHARAFSAALGNILGNGSPTALPADVLPREKYHGSTDGLICLNMAQEALGVPPEVAAKRLPELWQNMFEYFSALRDEEAVAGIGLLPGVLNTLTRLAKEESIICGLVTGNVEGLSLIHI